MILVPAVQGDWEYVQEVWDRWQSLNVGILAFLSSVIALKISSLNAKRDKDRQFVAARAFLPHSLSELCGYFKKNAVVLSNFWQELDESQGTLIGATRRDIPELPELYKQIFSRCIEFAPPEIADSLAFILMRLQVFHSRMASLEGSLGLTHYIFTKHELITYIYCLGELQVLVNKLFPFARGLAPFDNSQATWDDYQNAYSNLDFTVSDIDDLESFTLQRISKSNS